MSKLEFYFDFSSPYSYLAHTRLHELGVHVTMVPFDVLDVMKRVGNVPTSAISRAKGRYVRQDLLRYAARYGVKLQLHPRSNEIDSRRLLRATLAAAQLGDPASAVAAIFHARWCEPAPLETSAQIAALLGAAGYSSAAIEPLIDDPRLDETLDRSNAAAAERGVFGAPTFFIGDEMFFGNDRLDFVQARLKEVQ
jgi:2-hydroxychromene-2-carboxylate isomerase